MQALYHGRDLVVALLPKESQSTSPRTPTSEPLYPPTKLPKYPTKKEKTIIKMEYDEIAIVRADKDKGDVTYHQLG